MSKKTPGRWIAITSATLMTVFLVYTRTRGAWVALLFAVVVTALLSIPYRPATGSLLSSTWGKRLLATGALVVLTLSPWEPQLASTRARHIDEGKATLLNALSSASRPGADRGRRALWSHTFTMIGDHPLLGVGLETGNTRTLLTMAGTCSEWGRHPSVHTTTISGSCQRSD